MSCEKVENCLVGQPWLLSKLLNGPHMSSITLPTYLSPSLTDEQAPLVSSLLPLTVNAPAGGSLARARRPGLAGLASEEQGRAQDLGFGYLTFSKIQPIFGRRYALRAARVFLRATVARRAAMVRCRRPEAEKKWPRRRGK